MRYQPDDDVIAIIGASAIRRVIGTAALGGLGLLLLALAVRNPPGALILLALMAGTGFGALWLAWRFWESTSLWLELTSTELREAGSGRVLARIADVTGIERGALAFKPANGFLLSLRTPQPRVWAPGLWWRTGRRVGVGGIVDRQSARIVAELIAEQVAAAKPSR